MTASINNEAKTTIGNLLTEFGMIDSLLRSVYKQCTGIDPVHPKVEDGDLDKCFFDFLDSKPSLSLVSNDKIYQDQEGNKIHLQDLMQQLRQVRNIAAHQTWSLITGLSSLPIEALGQVTDSYVGTIEELDNKWRFYADQFLPIFECWNYGGFDGLV